MRFKNADKKRDRDDDALNGFHGSAGSYAKIADVNQLELIYDLVLLNIVKQWSSKHGSSAILLKFHLFNIF